MKPSILLRVAAVLSLLYFLGHTAGRPWTPVHSPAVDAVVDAMKQQRFAAMGRSRTYWDFYQGFGLAISLDLLVQTLVLWHLGTMAKADPARVRPLVALFCVALVANGVLGTIFFFPSPVVLAVAIAVCLALSLFVSRPRRTAVSG